MVGLEQGIADVFAALEDWLVTSGATQSMVNLAWAVLTVLWLGHVAAAMRPGREPDLIGVFGRLALAGGLLTEVGPLNRVIVLGFETFRTAGSAVLSGLIGQQWSQFMQEWLTPQSITLFGLFGPWFVYPWGIAILLIGVLLGIFLFAYGFTVYLAILFFAHLTLLLALFLAPLAMALLVAPGTSRWTARWLVVVVRTGLVVFLVRVVHAAAIYLAVIVPIRQVSAGLTGGLHSLAQGPGGYPAALGVLMLNLTLFLVWMIVGTGIGVYAMLRAERLTGQFVEGVAFGEGVASGSSWIRGQLASLYSHQSIDHSASRLPSYEGFSGSEGPWTVPGGPGSGGSGAQEATVIKVRSRFHH